MAAEIRLALGLDLAYFRQEMRKAINIVQSEFTGQVNVKINRQSLQRETQYLTNYFRRKNYRVNINTNLDAEILKANNLTQKLNEINGRKVPVSIQSAITNADVEQFRRDVQSKLGGIKVKIEAELAGDSPAASQAQTPQASTTRTGTFRQRLTALGKESKESLQALYRAAGEAGILAFDEAIANNKGKMISALNQAGEDSVQGLLNGLKSKEKSVGDAAKKLGKKLIASIKAELGIASPSKEFMEIGKDAGEGLEIGLIGYLQLIKNRATKEMRGIVAAVRFEAMKLGDINFGARAGAGPLSASGRAGILPPVGMGRIDLNARQMPTRMPRVASSTGATGAMSMLPSSAIETYRMGGAQLALPSAEMRAAAAAARSQERVAEAGRELTRSLREAAAAIPRRPGLGIRHMGTGTAGYTSPIGPLPTDSAEPWSPGSRGMYGGGGFEPFMNARLLTERVAIQGTQAFRAPAIGEQFKKVNEAFKGTQPIANRLREAAIAFSKDAPIVAQYLNSFRARKINISDLPGAGESPGQYIRRIQEAFRQGPFGAGTALAGGGGGFAFGQGPQVPGYPIQRALPPAGMTTAAGGPNYPFDRVTGGGGGGGGGGRGGAIVPYAPRTELPRGYFAGGKIQQALQGADQYLKQSRVPLTGAIQELGGEFGNAVKQVLLFGTAYKALAFLIDLPNQAFQAARSLQSFNNQVVAITGNAANAKQAIDFINASVEQFNIPLQSARDGFLKLYASMEPAGIPTDVIEGLFTGISQASATLGLSADQVDRVTYAFSQMASKGKIMSEEVTGQLGDVIPGALSLMADAAGLSMAEFKDAMEKGQLSGKAMQQVFENLEIVLSDRFGEGAIGAADTLQGSMNDLQTSVTRMYEAFEPLVELFATSAFPALSDMVRDATEAITAFTAGVEGASDPTANLSSRGLAMYNVLGQVATIAQSLKGVIESLAPTFITLGQVILIAVEQISRMLNTGAGQWLAKFAIQVALVTTALQLMARAGIGAAIRGLIMLVTNTKGAIAAFKVLITTTRIAKIALGGLVGGAIMVGLEMLAGKLLKVGDAARDAAADARQLRAELDAAVQTGNIEIPRMVYQAAENRAQSIKQSIDVLQKVKGGGRISAEEYARLQRTGLAGGITRGEQGVTSALRGQVDQSLKAAQTGYVAALNAAGTAKEQWESAIAVRRGMEAQRGAITPVDLSAGEGGRAKSKKAAKEIRDISADRLELSKRLFAAQEAENKVAIVNLQTALSVLDAEENIEGVNERQRVILEALSKRRLDLKKIAEDDAKEQERADEERLRRQEEINRAVQEYNASLIDAQEATGAISPDEASQRRRDAEQLQIIERLKGVLTPTQIEDLKLAFEAIPKVGSIGEAMVTLKQDFEELTNPVNTLMTSAQGIGDAFADAFSSIITGASSARESLGQFFGNVGKMFADMATRIITQWMVMKAVGLVGSLFPGSSPTPGGSGGSGIPFLTNLGEDAGSYRPIGIPLTPYGKFANGGVVTGPTMGLIGEGRFNEAVVPLPNGKSIPVDLGGGAGNNVSTNIVVNVNNGQASSQINGNGGQSLGRELEGAVRSVILKESRPGGIIYNQR